MAAEREQKVYRVGVFEHRGMRSVQVAAYTVYYNPQWPGCCEHTVTATSGAEAKRLATLAHRAVCMPQSAAQVWRRADGYADGD